MIVNFILDGILALLSFIMSLFTLPAMPLVIVNSIANIMQFFALPIGVLRNYVGDTFFVSIFVVLVVYVTVTPTIYIIMWIYQRVRG